ncbi:glycoside hydrolase [Hymenobacter sp. J193]|uniref:glycoside hydrolase family 76 protein n=1 Tax=Hymenobacter sp. J193 TaxID=2898429 RepID=UPI0021511024|nr:glycoside hydrolase family 76 protein [Hymenobacter sp. J193]MCR5890915.1 glycoside hydrolase [Hymenobacter sp. J193]MCR5891001.1 glycoside hydrolase [Hymenobacter sp. J193]
MVSLTASRIAGALLSLVLLCSCKEPIDDVITKPPTPPVTAAPANWAARADSAQNALRQGFFTAGQYYAKNNAGDAGFNYWWQAHGLDVLMDGYKRTSSSDYLTQAQQLQAGAKAKNGNTYLNEFYDDMEWQALACLRAFQLTGDPAYKATAKLLWEDIKTGWNEQQGGGIAWKKTQRDYKNTPANAPAAILAARLYLLDKNPDDLAWAEKIYQWQKAKLVDPATGLVWDGINRTGDGQIDKNWRFTYCQGVYIGAGQALYQATKKPEYLADATRTANFVLGDADMAPGGILKNENAGDGGLFKGILVRYLAQLAVEPDVSATNRTSYINFLKFNGESSWKRGARRPPGLFNTNWTTLPQGAVESSTQMSGVMLMEVMADLQARKLL